MKKRFSEKGFTLVEMVVVIAIIGVLAAIIVPSIINYVRKARLKADVTTGRMIAEEVIALITDDSRLRASLFLMTDKNNGFVETSNIRGSKTDMTVQCEGEAPYCIRAVLKMNGHRGTSGEKNDKWTGVDETAPLANALFDDDAIIGGDKTYAIPMRSTDYNGMVLNRWYICHRIDRMDSNTVTSDYNTIEIWAGNGTNGHWGTEPNYRLFPNPAPRVAKIKYRDGYVSTT